MKKLVVFLAVAGVLAGGLWYAIKTIDPVEKVRVMASAAVKAQTGRDLNFASARLMFWPQIGVRLNDVTLSNAAWSKTPDMMRLDAVDVRLVTSALLEKRFEVSQFVLQQPEIVLEKAGDGKANWAFDAPAKPAVKAENGGQNDAADLAKTYGFKLGEFLINKGKVVYTDHTTGKQETLDDINVAVTMPDMDSAAQIDGAVTWRGKKAQIVIHAEAPAKLVNGAPSAGGLSVKAPDISFDFEGTLATQGVMASGNVGAEIKNLQSLVSWAAGSPVADMPYQSLSFKSAVKASAERIQLSSAALKLDDLALAGDLALALTTARPALTGKLALDHLTLDRFLPKPDAAAGGDGTAARTDTGWSDAPMDLSALQAIDLGLTLDTKGFALKGIEAGPSTLNVLLENGALRVTSSPATLLSGQFNAAVSVKASATPEWSLSFDMKNVEAQPVLAAFADFTKLSGKVDASVDATGFGKSQRQIVSSLTGKGAAKFKNGAFQGLDLVNIAKLLQRNLVDMGVGEGKTEFVELGGTFTVAKGVVNNNDLKMVGPLVQTTGSGDIDLPQKMVRYRLVPVLTASAGIEGARGIGVPVDIRGPFSNIKIKPDYKTVITDTLRDPSALKETAKSARETLKTIKKDPKAALESILGGGGLFGKKPAAEEAPASEQPIGEQPASETPPPAPQNPGDGTPEGSPAQ